MHEASQTSVDRFVEALWLEDGLAANTLAAYRRDLGQAEEAIGDLAEAGRDDIVLIAGKGHETSQTSLGITQEFNDVEVAEEILRDMLLKGEL